jgi:prenyltransferase beta subunit
MMQYIALCLTSFLYIFAKAFQQLNVVYGHKLAVPPMTMVMAACEIFIGGNIAVEAVQGSWVGIGWTFIAMSAGSSAGALAAMHYHEKMRQWVKRRQHDV